MDKPVKPRVVVVFNDPKVYDEMKAFADSKLLDMKNFLLTAARSYVQKYAPKTASKPKDG